MKNKKSLIVLGISFLSLIGVVVVTGGIMISKDHFANAHATECDHHEGYHYLAKAPTIDESGWVEFWACCKCGHQYIGSAPEGDWVTRDGSLMDGSVLEGHIAYIPPLTSGGEGGEYWGKDPF